GVFLVTSRVLSPAEFGAVALAAATVSLAGTLVPVAFGEALIQRADLSRRHTDSVFWLTLLLAGAAMLLLWWMAPLIARWTGEPLMTAILPVLSLRLIFDAGMTVPAALLQRRMQFRHIALRTALANGLGAVLCIWMIVQGYALWALVISQVVTSLAACLVTLAVARWRPGVAVSRAALGELRVFGLYAMGGRIVTEARLDQLLMGVLLGPATLGLYYFARRLFRMLCDLTSGVFAPVTNVLIASLQTQTEARRDYYLAACFASASLAFPVFAGLIAIAPTAIPILFGPQWTEAIFAVQCLSIVGMMAGLGIMQSGLIRYLGHPGWWFWYQAAMQVSTLPLILIFYPLGLNAIMAAFVLRTLCLWPVSVVKAQGLIGITMPTYLRSLAAPGTAALVMALAVSVVPRAVPGFSGAEMVLTQVAVGAMVYGLVMVALSRAQIRDLRLLYRRERG
ncbi:MAG: lipopolysaccharide biosynthesis protein, partial [Boseongicola sp.]|nr:lipopolysaccharide biosynthesis protein [Boseongicola sp.]